MTCAISPSTSRWALCWRFIPRRSPEMQQAFPTCPRWWETVASVRRTAGAGAQVQTASLAGEEQREQPKSHRSANAFSRTATSGAAPSLIGAAATGARQTGAWCR